MNHTWTPATDAASQIYWQQSVGQALGKEDIIQAGVCAKLSIQELGPIEQSSGA